MVVGLDEWRPGTVEGVVAVWVFIVVWGRSTGNVVNVGCDGVGQIGGN